MRLTPFSVRPLLLGTLLLSAMLLSGGCDGCRGGGHEVPPWRFVSQTAPYQIIFPPEWAAESPEGLNPHADIAANRENLFFFMVIPQELPSFPRPTLGDLSDAALAMLDESVDNFQVDRRGPLELDGVQGISVLASGKIDGDPIAYIASYIIHDGFGYQIVAFTEGERYGELFEEVDVILTNWQFTSPQAGDDLNAPVPHESSSPDSSDRIVPGE